MATQEDVYESEDLPECEQSAEKVEAFDSEHIDSIHLDVGAALQRFKGKHIDATGVNFSDSIVERRRTGYGGGPYVLEYVGPGYGEPETPMQRFTRLHHEINELFIQVQQIQKCVEGEESSSVSQSDVGALQQQLKQLQVEQILGDSPNINITDPDAVLARKVEAAVKAVQKSSTCGKSTKEDTKSSGDKSDAVYELRVLKGGEKEAKVVDLEARLAKLESVLGSDTDKLLALTGGRGAGIIDAAQALNNKLEMLDVPHVDAVDAKLAVLLHKLTQIDAKQESLEGEDSERMGQLHQLITKWDSVCSALPDIVDRMHALHDLHEQALQFSQCLTQIDGVQQQLAKSVHNDKSLLQEIRSGLSSNMDTIKNNCDVLSQRLSKIQK